ncbi:MAG: FimB/Mfa2 family fimbrial subunit [Bacteroidales bacterium]|nr:FimB/Mfa2 family fimbrial subunit [Bacteroidales bacterium]
MRNKRRNGISGFIGALFCMASAALLSSCEPFFEDLPLCPHGVSIRFVYDYNMSYGNALPRTVDELTLLIYNEDSAYVGTRLLTKEELQDEDFRLQMELPEGTYHFAAYGGLGVDDASFAFEPAPDSAARWSDLRVGMDKTCLQDSARRKLKDFYWGTLTLSTADLYNGGTLHLMKNTNNIRVMLQQVDGSVLDINQFEFEIVDDNTLFDYQNECLPNDTVAYMPWVKGISKIEVMPDGGDTVQAEDVTIGFAELSTSRLMDRNAARLRVKRADNGQIIIDIPLVKYLMLMGSECHGMEAQEFLDRESAWTMLFFLRPNGFWLSTVIVVNDWEVRVNEAGL